MKSTTSFILVSAVIVISLCRCGPAPAPDKPASKVEIIKPAVPASPAVPAEQKKVSAPAPAVEKTAIAPDAEHPKNTFENKNNKLDSIMQGREFVFKSGDLPSRKSLEFDGEDAVPPAAAAEVLDPKASGQNNPVTVPGYRLQVFTTTDFEELKKKSWELKSILGRTGSYVIYNAPYYKLRVGDFCDKDDAYELTQKLQEEGFEVLMVPSPIQVKAKCR
jgi:hypothetical protein